MRTAAKTQKRILSVGRTPPKHWVGDGFHVQSLFSYDRDAEAMSPFLLLDYGAPETFAPAAEPRGVGEHPHRGFETVTIAYQGEVEHRDSTGASGKIGPGDVQWMTAASGVVHEEFHGRDFTRRGGTLEMVQLWVNLPARHKMSKPRYQDLLASAIPTVALEGGNTARVIAGSLLGTRGPAKTFTPIDLWDLRLVGGTSVALPVPEGHTTAVLVMRGRVLVNGTPATAGQLVRLDRAGDSLALEVAEESQLLLLAGEPIDEPVVGHGPFVMNTWDEIREAFRDFQAGKMGRLD